MSQELRFLAGGEVECILLDPSNQEHIEEAEERHFRSLNNPYASAYESMRDVHSDATRMLNGLLPKNVQEEQRLERWMQQVSDFGPAEGVNFRLYQQFALPTLQDTPPTLGKKYSEVARPRHEILEFRFGTDLYQEGYYDNPRVSELRITPCPPAEYSRRRNQLLADIGVTASAFGLKAYAAKEDVSVSAFWGEDPVFGDMRQDMRPYQAAVFGMRKCYQEDLGSYAVRPDKEPHLNIAPWRAWGHQIRVIPGRFEHRRGRFQDKAPNLLVDGITHGLQHATEDEIASIKTYNVLAVSPGPDFERVRDLGLMRVLGRMIVSPDGRVVPESDLFGSEVVEAMFDNSLKGHAESIVEYMKRERVFSLRDGRFYLDQARLPAFMQALPWHARQDSALHGVNYDKVQQRLDRIRVEVVPSIINRVQTW